MSSYSSKTPEEASYVMTNTQGAHSPNDRVAAGLRGFGAIGILAIIVILARNSLFAPVGAVLVLVWAWRSHTPWREIGYVRPRSWIVTLVVGIVFGCAFKLLMKAIVMPLLGADPINQAYHYLAGNRAAMPGAIFAMIFVAGVGEETLFRGYMFERLGKLFGSSVWELSTDYADYTDRSQRVSATYPLSQLVLTTASGTDTQTRSLPLAVLTSRSAR